MLADGPQLDRVALEIKRRIKVSVAAYAYEVESESIMSDAEYDSLSKLINPAIETGHEILDQFFREKFTDYSGAWILDHPELHRVRHTYFSYYAPERDQKRYRKALSVGERMHYVYEKMANRLGLEKRAAHTRFNPASPDGQLMAAVVQVMDEQNVIHIL